MTRSLDQPLRISGKRHYAADCPGIPLPQLLASGPAVTGCFRNHVGQTRRRHSPTAGFGGLQRPPLSPASRTAISSPERFVRGGYVSLPSLEELDQLVTQDRISHGLPSANRKTPPNGLAAPRLESLNDRSTTSGFRKNSVVRRLRKSAAGSLPGITTKGTKRRAESGEGLFQTSAAPALPGGSFEGETTNLHSLSGVGPSPVEPVFQIIEHRCTGCTGCTG